MSTATADPADPVTHGGWVALHRAETIRGGEAA